MKKNSFAFIILAVLFLLHITCRKGHRLDCFKNAGKQIVEIRDIGEFETLEVGQKFELELIWDTTVPPKAEIIYFDKLIGGVSTEIVNGTLHLKDNNVCNWVRKQAVYPKVKITHGDFKNLSIYGSAKVFSVKPIGVTELVIQHDGLENTELVMNNGYLVCNSYNTGSFILSGYARVLASTIDDIGVLDAKNLETEDIYLYHYSLNDAHISPNRVLHARLYNKANVYYYTEPEKELVVETFGTGRLIKK